MNTAIASLPAKKASPDYPIHELLAERWRPYAFADRPVSEADLSSLFEAARWARSSSLARTGLSRVHGRIIACGGISGYNEAKPQPGPSNSFNMTTKRLTMKRLLVRDWLDRQDEFEKEVGAYFREGKVKNKETVGEGIDHGVGAFLGLFEGKNVGKMVVKLA